MPPKKSVYSDPKGTKSTKTTKSKASGVLSPTKITMELAALKQRLGESYINKQLEKLKFASDAQMTAFIKRMNKKKAPREAVDIQGDIEMQKQRLGAGVVNDMLRNAGFLEPVEMEDLLETLRGMKPPKKVEVTKEERISTNSTHENLVKVAENSSSEVVRSFAKEVDDQLSVAQIEQNKIDAINNEIRGAIEEFKKTISISGKFDTSKNEPIILNAEKFESILAGLAASILKLNGTSSKFNDLPFDSIQGALRASFESTKLIVEAANMRGSDLFRAVESKISSEMQKAELEAVFMQLEDFIRGNMPRSIAESQKDYKTRLQEIEQILYQKQELYKQETEKSLSANRSVNELQEELQSYKDKLTGGEGAYNKLLNEYKVLENGVEKLNETISALKRGRNTFNALISKFGGEFDELAPKIDAELIRLENERNAAVNKLTENEGVYKQELEKLQLKVNGLERDLEIKTDAYNTAIEQYHGDMGDIVKSLNKIDNPQQRLEGNITLQDLKDKIRRIGNSKKATEEALSQARRQLSDAETKLRAKNVEIEDLNAQISKLTQAKTDVDSIKSNAQQKIEEYSAQNAELNRKLTKETEETLRVNKLLASQKLDFENREKALNDQFKKDLEAKDNALKESESKYEKLLNINASLKAKHKKELEAKELALRELEQLNKAKTVAPAPPSVPEQKVVDTLEAAADTIIKLNQENDQLRFINDGIIHPKVEFKGTAQKIGGKNEVEVFRSLAIKYKRKSDEKTKEVEAAEKRARDWVEKYSKLLEEYNSFKTRTLNQNQGLNSEASAHLQVVAEAANPNGQIAKTIELGQSILAQSLSVAPPPKAARVSYDVSVAGGPDGGNGGGGSDFFAGLEAAGRGLFGAIGSLFGGGQAPAGAIPGGDPDIVMDEGYLGPEDRVFEAVRIRAWRALGYRSETTTGKKSKRDQRAFTSSTSVGGFIVGHAPDWNLQPNELIFDFWNNYYNSSKPFAL